MSTRRRGTFVLALVCAFTARSANAQLAPPDFELALMADTSTAVVNGGTLAFIDSYLSINDQGVIAFTGSDTQGSKAFVIQNGQVRGITFFSASRQFAGAAINNAPVPDVASRDRVTGSPPTYFIRKWPADGSQAFTIVGRSPDDFSAGLLFVDVNDAGLVAFSALDTTAATQTLLMAGVSEPPTELARYSGNISVRPQVSNTGMAVIRDDQDRIVGWPFPSGAPTVYASAAEGFTATGRQPGISHDGRAIAFSGDRGNGEGVFVSVLATTGQNLLRVAGEGLDGFSDFDENDRVGVISTGDTGTVQTISVVFDGTLNGVAGIHVVDLTASEAGGTVTAVIQPPRSVARAGDTVGSKIVSGVELYDPFNRHGVLVLWASFTDGTHGIVRGMGDRDRDGLLDLWETVGIDVDQDGTIDLDLSALGADPDHKDIFVEIDAMAGRAPSMATMDLVANAFAAAPDALVGNPDGTDGVNLRYQLDETSEALAPWPSTWGDFDAFKAAHFGTVAQRASPNSANILAAKRMAYRYVVFADQYGGGASSGIAELPGNDCMVTLGHPSWPTPGGTMFEQAGTFMHEFGHTLGLRHGGADNLNYKPNYHSIMNYLWQLPGGPLNANWSLVYSGESFADLDEAALNEAGGVGGPFLHRFHPTLIGPPAPTCPTVVVEHGPLDLNGDGDKLDMGVARDLNQTYASLAASAGQALNVSAHLDWSAIVYDFKDSPDYADGMHASSPAPDEELSSADFLEQINTCALASTYCVATVNSLGCTPAIGSSGSPSLSGPDDLVVTAENVRSMRWGMLAWSLRPDQSAWFNGTLCIDKPVLRGPSQFSGGNPANDCSGTYTFPFSHAYMQANGLVAGDTVYCQILSRDVSTGTPMGVGLTDGLVFAICP